MAESPNSNAEGVLRVTVTAGGSALAVGSQLISAVVQRQFNRVPQATLVFQDGDMPEGSFPVSDAATLLPGVELSLSAGWGDAEETLFSGIVVRHGLKISGQNDARLVVECRDKAVKMTVGRKSVHYAEQTDSAVIETLIGNHGVAADVQATTTSYKDLFQHYCTDWDYMLARAEINGLLVSVLDGTVTVKPPAVDGQPVLTVTYGMDLIDFQADLDARHQYTAVQATAWDLSSQAVVQGTSAEPNALSSQGNVTGATLAQVMSPATFELRAAVAAEQAVLTEWAKAQQLKSALARVRGHARFTGSALAKVGALLELAGVGDRFNGNVLVTGLTHELGDGGWTTTAEFGQPIAWFTESHDIVAPPASGLAPGIEGLQVGKVVKLDGDPDGQNRIQVKVPVHGIETIWARLMQFHASNAFGALFVPEVDDEVVLGWFNNDPSQPVVLGSLYSSGRAPAYALAAENNTKAIVTRCKSKLEFDEDKKVITVLTPGGNSIVMSDDAKSIVLTDLNGNKVKMEQAGITLDSPKDILIKAVGKITLDATGVLTAKSVQDVKVEGLNVAATAQVGFTAKGNATAELSASGQTTVKGALVMIN